MKKISTEEFKDLVTLWTLVGALQIVKVDDLSEQRLRTLCRKFQSTYTEIYEMLKNPDPKLSLVQEGVSDE